MQFVQSQNQNAAAREFERRLFEETAALSLFDCPSERPAVLSFLFDEVIAARKLPADDACRTMFLFVLMHVPSDKLTLDMLYFCMDMVEEHKTKDVAVMQALSHCVAVIEAIGDERNTLSTKALHALIASLSLNRSPFEPVTLSPVAVDAIRDRASKDPTLRVYIQERFGITTAKPAPGSPGVPQPSAPHQGKQSLHILKYVGPQIKKDFDLITSGEPVTADEVRAVHKRIFASALSHREIEALEALMEYMDEFPTSLEPWSAEWNVNWLIELGAMSLLRSLVVPLLYDCAERLYATEKAKYPHGLKDIETFLNVMFFRNDPLTVPPAKPNLAGLGDAAGWSSQKRVSLICGIIRRAVQRKCPANRDAPGTALPALGHRLISEFNAFQQCVNLPNKKFYANIFLEPLALVVALAMLILQENYDESLTRRTYHELGSVFSLCIMEKDTDLLRKLAWTTNDVPLLKAVCDRASWDSLGDLGNSAPEYHETPLVLSSLRLILLPFLERIARDDVLGPKSHIQLTTVYANFQHFVALGSALEQEGAAMLNAFGQQLAGLKTRDKDTVKRFAKQADEIEKRYTSAATFFVQGEIYERCLQCLKKLHIVAAQRRLCTKLTGLNRDQVMQILTTAEAVEDVLSVAYGYDIAAPEDWALILYRQVVCAGRREMFEAYRENVVCVPPPLLLAIQQHFKSEAHSPKDLPARQQQMQWLGTEWTRGSL